MQKILELKGADWLKGESIYPSVAVGGLFQVYGGSNPFEQGGVALPSYLPQAVSSTETAKSILSYNDGSNNYIYAQGDAALARVLMDSPFTLASQVSQIRQHLGGNTVTRFLNACIWKNSYVYADMVSTNIVSFNNNALTLAGASDHTMRNEAAASVTGMTDRIGDFVPLCVGADGNLYSGNSQKIYEMTQLATGSSNADASFPGTSTGNTATYNIDDGFNIRDIITDGRYLIILADNNQMRTNTRILGSYRVQIYFWDMVQTTTDPVSSLVYITPTVKHEFNDCYGVALKQDDNGVFVISYRGISIFNSVTAPKLVRPFPITESANFGRPTTPNQIAVSNGVIYWTDGNNSYTGNIFAYGNPLSGQAKVFFQPYGNAVSSQVSGALKFIGNKIAMAAGNNLYLYNVTGATTRGALNITSLNATLEAPHKYEFTKVSCSDKLSSGQSITVSAYSRGGTQLISQETKSYNSANPKQNFVFKRIPTTTNQPEKMEDLTLVISTAGGAALQRVATYATPNDDSNEDI